MLLSLSQYSAVLLIFKIQIQILVSNILWYIEK